MLGGRCIALDAAASLFAHYLSRMRATPPGEKLWRDSEPMKSIIVYLVLFSKNLELTYRIRLIDLQDDHDATGAAVGRRDYAHPCSVVIHPLPHRHKSATLRTVVHLLPPLWGRSEFCREGEAQARLHTPTRGPPSGCAVGVSQEVLRLSVRSGSVVLPPTRYPRPFLGISVVLFGQSSLPLLE